MKKVSLLLFCLIVVAGCKKNELAGDNGCISRTNGNYVTGADAAAATRLLKNNKLPYENALFSQVILNDTINNVEGQHVYQHLTVILQFNGLPLLSSPVYYHFNGGVLVSSDGTSYKAININNRPTLTMPQVRKLYINAAVKNGVSAVSLKDSCLAAQLGYYNLNVGTDNSNPSFVRAWYITPKNSEYPLAIIRDDNGQTISYTSGIIVF